MAPIVDAATSPVAVEAGASIDAGVAAIDAGNDVIVPATDAGAADRAPIPSCATLAAAGAPTQLGSFQWMYGVGPAGDLYNRPYDTVTLENGCQLTYQAGTSTRTVTLNGADCAAARAWATNARFLDVLSTGDDCPYGIGNPDDLFEVNLTDGTMDWRKTYLCPEPTLDAVRACVNALVARSFP
ncbi:MAG TPA: hypothetical protein VH560_19695 [Polyangia bacterium]|nr:hypothetical protein [Polyangia bacterium]